MPTQLPPPSPAPPARLAPRSKDAHKGDFGRVTVVGGSRGMAGSIGLTASAALRTGAGLVTAAIPDRCLETVAAFNPCVMTIPLADDDRGRFASEASDDLSQLAPKCDAWAIGPGMGTGDGSMKLIDWLLSQSQPRVIDADGLNCLAQQPNWSAGFRNPTVLTPHPGEWQRLSGVPASDRPAQMQAARQLAKSTGAVILLKGSNTLVTDGSRDYINPSGNPGMATGGSGDCLTGIVATLLAQGWEPFLAASLGAWVHGRAGDLAASERGTAGMIALDLLDAIPAAVEDATEARV